MSRPIIQKFHYFFIYVITNKINGKKYVGFHATNNFNDGYMGSGVAINDAIKKYGIENFSKEILEECNIYNWGEKERYWIKKLKTYNNGYNLTIGGEGSIGLKLSNESKKKISESNKGNIPWNKNKTGLYSLEYKEKLSKAFKNKTISEETKQKISKANTGKIKSEAEKNNISKRMKENNPGSKYEVKQKVSASLKGKFTGENNPMSGVSRSKENLKNYRDSGIELKGDRWEYMRRKIKCIDLETQEILIFDGVKDMEQQIGLSKNKYYRLIKISNIIGKYEFIQ